MREAGAIFLCGLILLNWIAGCWFCFETTLRVELLLKMDARESAIAQQIERQLREGFLVWRLEKGSAGLRGDVYSGAFLFADGEGADADRYLLVDESRTLTFAQQRMRACPFEQEEDPRAIALQKFFKEYLHYEGLFSVPPFSTLTVQPVYFAGPLRDPFLSTLSPPPDC
jgi:hypothetical protein